MRDFLPQGAGYNCLPVEFTKEVLDRKDCCPQLSKHPDTHLATVSNKIHCEVLSA